MKLTKKKKIFLFLFLIILGYILFPKKTGFREETVRNGMPIILGEYNPCLGIELSQKIDNGMFLRCIGIPLPKITI